MRKGESNAFLRVLIRHRIDGNLRTLRLPCMYDVSMDLDQSCSSKRGMNANLRVLICVDFHVVMVPHGPLNNLPCLVVVELEDTCERGKAIALVSRSELVHAAALFL